MEFSEKVKRQFDELREYIINADNLLNDYQIAIFYQGLGLDDLRILKHELYCLSQIQFYFGSIFKEHVRARGFYKKYLYNPKIGVYERQKFQKSYFYYKSVVSYEKYLHNELNDIMIRIQKIVDAISDSCEINSEKEFIKRNSSLLHLVSSNNHSKANIKRVSDDAYLFNCQFHHEGTPSMRVNSHSNKILCYGCGIELDIYEYVMKMHNIDFLHAKYLLAAINNIYLPNNPYSNDDEEVKYYQNAYNLRRYKKRLATGLKRAKGKPKTLNNYLAMQKYTQEFNTIERIKSKEVLTRDKTISRCLKIEMPEFDSDSGL